MMVASMLPGRLFVWLLFVAATNASGLIPNPCNGGEKECCFYRPVESTEYQACCQRHGCCPSDCSAIEYAGCCYNASSYRLGSVVAELPECCTNLVCGAKLTNAQPFFTTTIAQIIYEPHSGQYCGTPNFRYCMEQNGIIRMEGSEWYVTPCRKCGCERGVVDCTNVSPVCPPAPEPHCIAIPGSCCPTWDCRVQTGCIDERGTHRALGDTWPDPRDPCNIWVCTRNGPVNMPLKQCHPLPLPPNSDCRVVVVDCCNTWDCSTGGCTDGSGHHEIGDKWLDPTDPCTILTCTHSGIQKSNVKCPPIPPPPQEGCQMVKEQCCYVWRCSGCVDQNGVPHEEGSMWEDPRDPCTIHVCMNGQIETFQKSVIDPCPRPGPKPHEGCVYALVDCCHQWNCTTSGCNDRYGNPRDIGEVWPDLADSCYSFHCTPTGIERQRTICPKISSPPHTSCTLDLIGCCYNWTCPTSRCTDAYGQNHNLGDVWPDPTDSCYTFTCTSTGIERSRVTCPPLGPEPHASCTLQHQGCCYNWTCQTSGCNDRYGNPRDIGEVWPDLADSCYSFHCTPTGIERQRTICPKISSPPHTSCTLDLIGCCYNWTCPTSRCTDAYGQNHNLGDVWPDPTDSCYTFTCTSTGIERSRVTCPPLGPEPHASCTLQHQGCCYNWTCQSCPDPNSFGRVCVQYQDQCYTDSQCPPGYHCCLVAGCGKECIPETKPGSCPTPNPDVDPFCFAPVNACQRDQDCTGREKCCVTFCGKECRDPIY